jgi:hypothetical protein
MSSDNRSIDLNRRHFFKTVGLAAGGIAVLQLLPKNSAAANDLPHLEESESMGMMMGYKEDTTKVDPAKYPDHKNEQTCLNCKAWQGTQTDDYAGCRVFSGKSVAAKGWCQVWAPPD